MRVRHFGFAGVLMLALVGINPGTAGAVPGAASASVFGVQSDVVQVGKRYKRYNRRRYHRRFYYDLPYGYYYYRRPNRYYYRPYRYYNRPYYRYNRGYPYYGRPGVSLYFRF